MCRRGAGASGALSALVGLCGLVGWARVGCFAVWCFSDRDGVDLRVRGERCVEAIGKLVGDVFGDKFGGGVEGVEGGGFVEVLVGEGLADVDELCLDGVEVAEEAVVVEGLSCDGCGGDEVVAVDGFLGAEDGDGVGGAELVGDLDGEHGWTLGFRSGRCVWVCFGPGRE